MRKYRFWHILEIITTSNYCAKNNNSNLLIFYMESLHLPPFSVQDTQRKVNDRTAALIGKDTPLDSKPYLAAFNLDTKEWQPGWLPSQQDLFSYDWEVLNIFEKEHLPLIEKN